MLSTMEYSIIIVKFRIDFQIFAEYIQLQAILTYMYINITHSTSYLCSTMKTNIYPLNQSDMNTAIVFTPHVLNTLRALPYEERLSVASALAGELLLGAGQCSDLAPEESMIYEILRFYVNQASARYNNAK